MRGGLIPFPFGWDNKWPVTRRFKHGADYLHLLGESNLSSPILFETLHLVTFCWWVNVPTVIKPLYETFKLVASRW